MKKYIIFLSISLLFSQNGFTRESLLGGKSKNSNRINIAKASTCAPAQGFKELSFNNVRMLVETSGLLWEDRPNGAPNYFVPKELGVSSIFAGSLWMGGKGPGGNLKLAAIRFRQDGNDFWPGPISKIGQERTVSPETCVRYDKVYKVNRQEIELWIAWQALSLEDQTNTTLDPPSVDIVEWPGTNDAEGSSDNFLAPFMDKFGSIVEDGTQYDYNVHRPFYDLNGDIDCRTRKVTDQVPLFGDETLWWVMNDIGSGNIHTESGGDPIGMEIRAQAFAFATNDEVNNMTFYNYTLINQGTLTLTDTYFAQYTDTDLGNAADDYVGCDVGRGLAYAYNGDNDDSGGSFPTYGAQPPSIGVDFFEGPYQDADGINNAYGIGESEALNGLGYRNENSLKPDDVVDNERYGMRKFFYFNNITSGPTADPDPSNPLQHYNYMTGIWKDGVTRLTYGGSGYQISGGLETDFCFPGESDPLNWGTNGVVPALVPNGWTEENVGNTPQDRRLLQSAGPFTLDPGEFNNITVGVVYARANTGGPFASVNTLLLADDKAQSLFENCFKILNGPDAPDLSAQELDQQIILYLNNNNNSSNNKNELYLETDAGVPESNGLLPPFQVIFDRDYTFQGYQIYQVRDASISANDVEDPNKAKLIAQCDIKDFDALGNPIGSITNYENNAEIGEIVPVQKVNGANNGIFHSLVVTQDKFSTSDNNALINFKKYYFLATAYGYNNYKTFEVSTRTGQAKPYLSSRSAASGGKITALQVTPHKTNPESGGTIVNSSYGEGVEITRIEGQGNGGLETDLSEATTEKIMSGYPWKVDDLTYRIGKGPLAIKVTDPLAVKSGKFRIRFVDSSDEVTINTRWELFDVQNPEIVYPSETSIRAGNEQIFPELGISVNIIQYKYYEEYKIEFSKDQILQINVIYIPKDTIFNDNGVIDSIIYRPSTDTIFSFKPDTTINNIKPDIITSIVEYKDPSNLWLSGIADIDGPNPFNWIRSGLFYDTQNTPVDCDDIAFPGDCQANINTLSIDPCVFQDFENIDNNQSFEGLIGGIIAPYSLVENWKCGPGPINSLELSSGGLDVQQSGGFREKLTSIGSIDLVFTPDKSKWSRCPVMEMQTQPAYAQGGVKKGFLRSSPSVDKNGIPIGTVGCNEAEAGLNGHLTGMGWFPGYAIDIETGERMNVAFGEDSYLSGDNGRDMLWNPSSRLTGSIGFSLLMGGQHYVYVFKNRSRQADDKDLSSPTMPLYDEWKFGYPLINGGPSDRRRIFRGGAWIFSPLLAEGSSWKTPQEGLVPSEVKIKIRLAKPYDKYATTASKGDPAATFPYTATDERVDESQNNWMPLYEFNTSGAATTLNDLETAKSALDIINIVPNPYYAYSSYEINKIDNRVKFTNLPQTCSIRIYNMSGTLIRTLDKDNPSTFLDWDLKNQKLIPVSGGVYIVHVNVPGVGEKILKFFAIKRPSDLDNF